MLKILLVDDERQEREGIRFLIEKYGFPLEIAEATNGKTALEYIKSQKVDILFTDISMPYMDGLELAKRTNEYDPSIAIIIFSAYSEFEYAKKACQANAMNYLLKPIELDEFQEVMKKVINVCNERKVWNQKRELLEKADKTMLLYKMVVCKESIEEIVENLKTYNVVLQDKHILFFSVETGTGYFERRIETFNKILRKRIQMNYEYINIYPNQAYILLYKNSKFLLNEIETTIKNIYQDMLFDNEEIVSIIVGECFSGIGKISEEIEKIEKLREEIFSCFSGIQYLKNMNHQYQQKIEEAARIKEDIFKSIKEKKMSAVKLQLDNYMKWVENEKSFSMFYTKYILLDIIKALYEAYGIYNSNVIYETSDKIMKCNLVKDMQEILSEILLNIEKSTEHSSEEENVIVRELESIIMNEYMHDLSLEELSERVFLSPAYISYIFKMETGENIVKYLMNFRMKKAKEMLEKSGMKIVEIGKACGYPNQSYFNRLFKNMFGMTPKQYRENLNV